MVNHDFGSIKQKPRIASWLATTGLPAVAPLRIGEGWVWKGWVSWIKTTCVLPVWINSRIKFTTESLWHEFNDQIQMSRWLRVCRSIEWPAAITCGAFIGRAVAVAGSQCGANARHDGAGVAGLLVDRFEVPFLSPWNGRPLDRRVVGCVQLMEDSLKCLSFGSSLSGVYTKSCSLGKHLGKMPTKLHPSSEKGGWGAALYTYRLG